VLRSICFLIGLWHISAYLWWNSGFHEETAPSQKYFVNFTVIVVGFGRSDFGRIALVIKTFVSWSYIVRYMQIRSAKVVTGWFKLLSVLIVICTWIHTSNNALSELSTAVHGFRLRDLWNVDFNSPERELIYGDVFIFRAGKVADAVTSEPVALFRPTRTRKITADEPTACKYDSGLHVSYPHGFEPAEYWSKKIHKGCC